MRIAVLHDGAPELERPDEQDGLLQARAVGAALGALGHEPRPVGFGLDLERAARDLRALAPELVVNLVESVAGQGRLIALAPSLLDALGLPYTGASAEALTLTSHKVLAKRWMARHGLPTPAWFEPGEPRRRPPLPGRYLVKSIWEDASLGLDDESLVEAQGECELARETLARAPRLGGAAFAEAFVPGREFNLSLLAKGRDVEVLPPAEILFSAFPPGKPRIVGYAAKWLPDSFEYEHTPRSFQFAASDRELLGELESLARRCFEIFGLRGYARVDFRVDERGRPWILEVNANPSLSPDAGFLEAAGRANLALPQLVGRILEASSPAAAG
jgi:D-alanine-D-alanine ligase